MEALFSLCCGIMYALGSLLGLSYEEVCVIGNIYVQGALLVAATATPLWYAFKQGEHHAIKIITVVNILCCSALVLYFCFRYAPPLGVAFDRCVDDLNNLAAVWNTTYVVVNVLIFVLWWVGSIAWNLLTMIFMHEGRRWVSMAMLLLHVALIVFLWIG